jgi:hypothetical protein
MQRILIRTTMAAALALFRRAPLLYGGIVCCVLLLGDPAGIQPASRAESGSVVRFEMRNVHFRFTEHIVAEIRSLSGTLVPSKVDAIPVFDDKDSFVLVIDAGEVAMAPESLTVLMNDYAFSGDEAPVGNVKVTIEEGKLRIAGRLRRRAGIPFDVKGEVGATPDGNISLLLTDLKALRIPIKGVMEVFGLEAEDVVGAQPGRGVGVQEDTLVLDPERILPPPRLRGKVTKVGIDGNRVIQWFGGPVKATLGPRNGNYMAFRGGLLRFGKLTMHDSDLILIDADASDGFDFFLDRYAEQLAAGLARTTRDFGLRVTVPDFAKLPRRDR